jgi:hypothetical protein
MGRVWYTLQVTYQYTCDRDSIFEKIFYPKLNCWLISTNSFYYYNTSKHNRILLTDLFLSYKILTNFSLHNSITNFLLHNSNFAFTIRGIRTQDVKHVKFYNTKVGLLPLYYKDLIKCNVVSKYVPMYLCRLQINLVTVTSSSYKIKSSLPTPYYIWPDSIFIWHGPCKLSCQSWPHHMAPDMQPMTPNANADEALKGR